MIKKGLKRRTQSAKAWRELCHGQGGQTTVEYMLAVLFLAVVMGYSLPVLFEALADLFTQLGAEFAKPYP